MRSCFGRGAQLLVRVFKTVRQLAHDLHGHLGELGHQPIEHVLRYLEGGQRFARLDGGGSRHVAQDGDLAEETVLLHLGHRDLSAGRVDKDIGRAAQDYVHGIPQVALVTDFLTSGEIQPLAGERQELQLGRLDLGEDRHALEKLDFLVEVHRVLLGCLRPKP